MGKKEIIYTLVWWLQQKNRLVVQKERLNLDFMKKLSSVTYGEVLH